MDVRIFCFFVWIFRIFLRLSWRLQKERCCLSVYPFESLFTLPFFVVHNNKLQTSVDWFMRRRPLAPTLMVRPCWDRARRRLYVQSRSLPTPRGPAVQGSGVPGTLCPGSVASDDCDPTVQGSGVTDTLCPGSAASDPKRSDWGRAWRRLYFQVGRLRPLAKQPYRVGRDGDFIFRSVVSDPSRSDLQGSGVTDTSLPRSGVTELLDSVRQRCILQNGHGRVSTSWSSSTAGLSYYRFLRLEFLITTVPYKILSMLVIWDLLLCYKNYYGHCIVIVL